MQYLLTSQLTSISEGISPICRLGTRLVACSSPPTATKPGAAAYKMTNTNTPYCLTYLHTHGNKLTERGNRKRNLRRRHRMTRQLKADWTRWLLKADTFAQRPVHPSARRLRIASTDGTMQVGETSHCHKDDLYGTVATQGHDREPSDARLARRRPDPSATTMCP